MDIKRFGRFMALHKMGLDVLWAFNLGAFKDLVRKA